MDWKTQVKNKKDAACQTDEDSYESNIKCEKDEENHDHNTEFNSAPNKHLNSLDEKILRFESMLKKCENERNNVRKILKPQEKIVNGLELEIKEIIEIVEKVPDTPIIELCPLTSLNSTFLQDINAGHLKLSINDNIECEMEKLFGGEEEEDEFAKIFGIHIEKKIDKVPVEEEIMQPIVPEIVKSNDDIVDMKESKRKKLKDSIWPCELHMQRLRYRNVMLEIADKGMRHHEKVRKCLLELFGEDSDDEELCCYSPSIELDETLMGSCKTRIAPWVVAALMPPLKEGRIASRQLFKKLAKRLAESILLENQYPDYGEIKMYVEYYFQKKEMIHTIEDIT